MRLQISSRVYFKLEYSLGRGFSGSFHMNFGAVQVEATAWHWVSAGDGVDGASSAAATS